MIPWIICIRQQKLKSDHKKCDKNAEKIYDEKLEKGDMNEKRVKFTKTIKLI